MINKEGANEDEYKIKDKTKSEVKDIITKA